MMLTPSGLRPRSLNNTATSQCVRNIHSSSCRPSFPRFVRCKAASVERGTDRPWLDRTALQSKDVSDDPFSVLMGQRIVFLGGEVDEASADAVVSQLLLLDSQDPTKDIKLFINSPGGSVTAGMGIYDAIHMCRGDVGTLCFGLAASMGAFLLCAGKRGKRYSLPNSRIMIHQPLGGASGQAVDIEIQAKEIMYHKANLNRIMAENTRQPLSRLEADTDRDNYMNPAEARDYGLIDHIVGGEKAVYGVKGSMRRFPKLNEAYVTDREDMLRSVLDGDPFVEYTPSYRFKRVQAEPLMPSLAAGKPWFKLQQVSKEQYKEFMESKKAAQNEDKTGPEPKKKKTAKEKIDSAW